MNQLSVRVLIVDRTARNVVDVCDLLLFLKGSSLQVGSGPRYNVYRTRIPEL